MSASADRDLESVESFRARARAWIASHLTPLSEVTDPESDDGFRHLDEAAWLRARELQARLHAGGFAGICYPREYGGLGLTPAHQRAFNEEVTAYEMPILLDSERMLGMPRGYAADRDVPFSQVKRGR